MIFAVNESALLSAADGVKRRSMVSSH